MTGGYGPLCGCVSHACPQARGAAARWAGAAHLRVSRVSAHRHAHAHPSHRRTPLCRPNSPAPTARPPAEFPPARKTKGERPELRPGGPRERRGAAASRPGCLPHLANGVFRTVFPRQCPLGVGSHTERAQQSVSVTQGPPGCSRGGRGTPRFPRVKLRAGEQESSHPT